MSRRDKFKTVFETIKQLIDAPAETDPPSVEPKHRIGFPTGRMTTEPQSRARKSSHG
jgi:hypothetical protein